MIENTASENEQNNEDKELTNSIKENIAGMFSEP
jgi:hypothetical protein